MPRCARKTSETGIYHIMLRGINRKTIFEDDEDRERFINTLGYYKPISNYELYGYCLMDNHVHLLLKEQEPISMIIKRISSSFVYWYNQKYERYGHLFQDRFKSEAVEEESYFLTVLRYIHQNPVKSGLAQKSSEYKWSSRNEYFNEQKVVDTDFALKIFCEDRAAALDIFDKYMNESTEDKCLEYDVKCRLSDQKIRIILAQHGLSSINNLEKLETNKQNELIRAVKLIDGITKGQLARITGISKRAINGIWRD